MSRTPTKTRIHGSVGDTLRHTFQIKEYGVKGFKNVSTATAIVITWEDPAGANQTPLPLSAITTGADWALGQVVAEFTPSDVMAAQGTYSFALRGTIDGETSAWQKGVVEVGETPGI